MNKNIYTRFFKRPLDLIFSLFALILLLPVFIFVAFLIKINLGSPVIFKQPRPGLNENIFHLYKFRTMTNEKDNYGNLLKDELRLTKFGKFLRASSLDELPSLINIIKGEMSLVGPRPLLVEYLNHYNSNQKKRHYVKPGLTGYAQIKGRNKIKWKQKFDYDIFYVENCNFFLDISIIITTFYLVLTKVGISSDTSVTMDSFKGNSENSL